LTRMPSPAPARSKRRHVSVRERVLEACISSELSSPLPGLQTQFRQRIYCARNSRPAQTRKRAYASWHLSSRKLCDKLIGFCLSTPLTGTGPVMIAAENGRPQETLRHVCFIP
jgi:hypothetical protein